MGWEERGAYLREGSWGRACCWGCPRGPPAWPRIGATPAQPPSCDTLLQCLHQHGPFLLEGSHYSQGYEAMTKGGLSLGGGGGGGSASPGPSIPAALSSPDPQVPSHRGSRVSSSYWEFGSVFKDSSAFVQKDSFCYYSGTKAKTFSFSFHTEVILFINLVNFHIHI